MIIMVQWNGCWKTISIQKESPIIYPAKKIEALQAGQEEDEKNQLY